MNNISVLDKLIPAMSDESLAKVRKLEAICKVIPQIPITTEHLIHAGIYSRTVLLPAGCIITGALIKIPTTLIVSGNAIVFVGDKSIEISGYNILSASGGRKQAFIALTGVYLTMLFATDARTVEEAEREFTDEFDMLISHHEESLNKVTIVEALCRA